MQVEDTSLSVPQSSDFLQVLLDLIQELQKQKVRYCHWKSNYHLNYALSGEEDWDVLVHVEDFPDFVSLITSVGFKSAISSNDAGQFGVYHFYGLDTATGKLVHIHAYSRIVSGDSLVKSYCLPVEGMLLNNLRHDSFMPVPCKEADLLVFILRNALKSLSPLDIYMQRNDRDLMLEELTWLTDGLNEDKFELLRLKYFSYISNELLNKFLDCLQGQKYSAGRWVTAWKLSRRLKRFTRMSFFATQMLTVKILVPLIYRKFFRRAKYMRFENGGKIVVLVGPQAVGKSTVANALTEWIGKEFDVSSIHVGKPPSTLITSPIRLLLPLLRKLMPSERSTQVEKRLENGSLATETISYLHIIRKLILAYERKSVLTSIFRQASAGRIMICDRYPSQKIGAVDGASFTKALIDAQASRFKRFLMLCECKIYEEINSPHLILSLFVDVDEAVRRAKERKKEGPRDPEYVKFRHNMKSQPEFSSGKVVKIDTGTSLEKTLEATKIEFWKVM
jgi:thymidylate kinase